jgi:tRNA(Ile)-lysidine synthase
MNDKTLISALQFNLQAHARPTTKLCVALSGGIDSMVLLQALRSVHSQSVLRAVHVDHGLHADSAKWAEFCQQSCQQLDIPLVVCCPQINPEEPGGPEARARDARYAAFRAELADDEVLVTAHHRQDQAETLLLQLMRGAGPAGLAAMSVLRTHAGLTILRPMLEVSAAGIQSYARAAGLNWIDDPSNQQLDFDRNYLRHEILPRLEQRWPAAAQVISRSARLCAQAADLVAGAAAADLRHMLVANQLELSRLTIQSPDRQAAILRAALVELMLPIPSEQQLLHALETLTKTRMDAQPQVQWPGVVIRRYRGVAWLYSEAVNRQFDVSEPAVMSWDVSQSLDLGPAAGALVAVEGRGSGIAVRHLSKSGVQVKFRQGGERMRVAVGGRQRSLKNLLQENNVIPWMRSHIPLLYSGEQLLAIGDLWVHADFLAAVDEPGLNLKWHSHSIFR